MQPRENTVWFAKMKNSRKLIRVSTKSDYKIQSLIFSTGFAGIESKIALNYLWSFVASKEFDELKNSLANGTTMEAINNTNIQKIPFLVPDNVILNNFEKIANDIYNKVEKNQDENQKLAEIRDTLLPKLMNGEIEVPV